jgi:hypothetical protein
MTHPCRLSVDRGAVKGYISDLRAVLGDDPRAPRFIASEGGSKDAAARGASQTHRR